MKREKNVMLSSNYNGWFCFIAHLYLIDQSKIVYVQSTFLIIVKSALDSNDNSFFFKWNKYLHTKSKFMVFFILRALWNNKPMILANDSVDNLFEQSKFQRILC